LARDVFADGGQIKMCSAISAVEIACWDIMGKALGQPIFDLIGRNPVRAYANGWYRCPRKPQEFWRQLTRSEENLSIDIVAAVRGAVGPNVDLAIEAHARFSVDTAIHVGKLLEPLNPVWYEDPVPHDKLHATVEVARRLSLPVVTGEIWFWRNL
jgi:galactonate dehydratase